jgi:hypothetical protein
VPHHHPQGAPPLVPAALDGELVMLIVSAAAPWLLQIMHAIRSDLSEFKCGLAHLFCTYMMQINLCMIFVPSRGVPSSMILYGVNYMFVLAILAFRWNQFQNFTVKLSV